MNEKKSLSELSRKIDELSVRLEKLKLAEYLEVLRNPRRLLYVNFWGDCKGLGWPIGSPF